MSTPIKVGIVGTGFAAGFHLKGLRRVHTVPVQIAGVYSRNEERRQSFSRKYQIQAYDDLDALIESVDVIDICSPGCTHEDLVIHALKGGRHVIVEKPFTGYYGPPGDKKFKGNTYPKAKMLKEALKSCGRMLKAERASGKKILYAENWVNAPAIQKERDIIVKTKAQILWMLGEESHNGSHSPSYGIWSQSGGGSIVGKGCHPLTAALFLKQEEGLARNGKPIAPVAVSARVHELTRIPKYIDKGFIRTDYHDIEDFGMMHVVFQDGTVADIFTSEIVMGGVQERLEVYANNHRTTCNLTSSNPVTTYNPSEEQFKDVYVVEKTGTKQGWSHPALDEDWMNGYPQEFQDFMEAIHFGRTPQCGSSLGRDCVAAMYAAYLSAERKGAEVKIPA